MPTTHRIEPGQEYVSCDPHDHIRIRTISNPYPDSLGNWKVDIVTLATQGRETGRRWISTSALRGPGAGRKRREGYRLVQHADSTPAATSRLRNRTTA
jgi:hypothetical protein